MRRDDYIVTQAWMLELDLTDKQEKVYALIWGYSRDGHGVWRGTAAELAAWARCSERHAKRIIHELEGRGLIAHDVIAWSNGEMGGTRSEFWAVLPDDAAAPVKGGKKKVAWRERKSACPRGGRDMDVPRGRDMDVPRGRDMPPMEQYQGIHILSCGSSSKNTRDRAKKTTTTTTTGNLFNDDLPGLTPGFGTPVSLPFSEPYFREAWEALLRQPRWQEKTPEQLAIQLERLADTGDPVLSAYCCRLAIERGWDAINDPQATGIQDQDKLMAFVEKVESRREAAAA